jgi:hypothetical protein
VICGIDRRTLLLLSAGGVLDGLLRAAGGPAAGGHPRQDRLESRPDDEAALLRAFLKRPKDAQQRAIAELRKQIAAISSPWLARVAELVDRGTKLRVAKVQGFVPHPPHREEPGPFHELPCAIRHEYLWGHRTVRAIEKRPPLSAGAGKDAVSVPLDSPAEELLAALRGLHPDLDLALAGALAELDVDSEADKLALFLESWRNGQESFYRALDRSAGTKEAVFYFDAMLGEFQARFAPKGTPGGEELKSLKQLHDALHDAFLVYRQYRAMREAAACTAVLPFTIRLPRCLQRYDTSKEGYALRDDLLILAEIDGHDPLPGLRMIHETMTALPRPLWSTQGKYEALQPFQRSFDLRLKKSIADHQEAGFLSSEVLRGAAAGERLEVANRIRELAKAAALAN